MATNSTRSRAERLRRAAGSKLVDNAFRGLSRLGRFHPRARPEKHGVEVIPNIAYNAPGHTPHLLDVYRPRNATGPLPVVLYVHGGGFRILSKDTHWLMALAFARRGYLVFNINYRLAPKHPYPAAVQDCCDAFVWVQQHAEEWGGDPGRLVLAGESAGGNLVSSLAVATCFERNEPWAQAVYETERVPDAVIAACGMLQVTDAERFRRRKSSFPLWLQDRLDEVNEAYLPHHILEELEDLGLANPLCLLEQTEVESSRPLPPFFAPVGTKDPLLDDTRRLAAALDARGVTCDARYYPGEVHAFHAFIWRPRALECWRDTYAFLDRYAPVAGR